MAPPQNGARILVADDSLTIQKVIRLALANEGFEIQAVSDGNDAFQQARLFLPDIMLVDVSLPGKTAIELRRELRSAPELAGIRMILMSSAFEQVDESGVEKAGFDGRLVKPFDPANLRKSIQDVLATLPPRKRVAAPPVVELPPTPPVAEVALPAPTLAPDFSAGIPGILDPIPASLPEDAPAPPLAISVEVPVPSETPGAPEAPSDAESDIKGLTESTIRMSGLDDLQWNVAEPAAKPTVETPQIETPILTFAEAAIQVEETIPSRDAVELSPPPPAESLLRREIPPPTLPDTAFAADNPVLRPPPGFFGAAVPGLGASAADARFDVSPELTLPPTLPALPPSSSIDEETLRRQLDATLEKMARELLPDIAERIIRKEISRMLSEGSGSNA